MSDEEENETCSICFIFALLISCSSDSIESKEYKFYFREMAGLNTYLIDPDDPDGERIPFQFSSYSDELALKSCRGLKWNILYANGDGQIRFQGRLDPESSVDDDGYGYHEFILEHWYISTPFMRLTDPEEALGLSEEIEVDSLTLNDFKNFEGKENFDIANHQK